MNEKYKIRFIHPEDAEKVKEIALKSWNYTYKEIFSPKEIQDQNNQAYNVDSLKSLANRYIEDQTIEKVTGFYVLCLNDDEKLINEIIGFAQAGYEKFWELDFEDKEEMNKRRIVLFRIYLDPEYIGKGLGTKLLEKIEEFVSKTGKSEYGLYVHKDNEIGKEFYKKRGFNALPDHDKEDEYYLIKKI